MPVGVRRQLLAHLGRAADGRFRPVAGLSGWGAAATASVAALVSVVSFSASSVTVTLTLMVWPSSAATRV